MMSEKEENMKLNHNIPIGSLVEVKYDEWFGDGACMKVHARLWVVDHIRDCDKTPLYNLSEHKPSKLAELKRNLGEYCVKIIGGFSEESLSVIEMTDDLKLGYGSLNWDDD